MPDKPRSRGRRSDIPWALIRAAYEAGETNVTTLSRRFHVARGPIIKHRNDEKWTVTEQAKEQLKEQARSNVISLATRQAIESLGGEAGIKEQGDAIAAELQAQRPLLLQARALLTRTFERALRLGQVDDHGEQVPGQLILGAAQGETTAVSDLLNALSKFVRDGRLTNGLSDGQSSVGAENDDGKKRLIFTVADEHETA